MSHWYVRNKRKGLESLARAAEGEGEQIVMGEVVSISDSSAADGSWLIGQVKADDGATLIPFVGKDLLGCDVGCTVRLVGRWEEHVSLGWQFRAERVESRLPVGVEAIARFLAAHIKGCGPSRARAVAERFGAQTLEILAERPAAVRMVFQGKVAERLEKEVARWSSDFRAQENARRVEAALMGSGMTRRMAQRVLGHFRRHQVAEEVVLKHPYRLVEVPGIGFRRADLMARQMGIAVEDPSRIMAGVVHSMETLMNAGHSAAPRQKLAAEAARALGVGDLERVERAIQGSVEKGMLAEEGELLFLPRVLELEKRLAKQLRAFRSRRLELSAEERGQVRELIQKSGASPPQEEAVWMALLSGVSILTGRPGSGKTFTTRVFVEACQSLGLSVAVAAPTGKAAARAAEVTGLEAKTVHRLIGLGLGEVGAPLEVDVLVVDEVSMADLETTAWLLRNLDPRRTRLLLVGDHNQLPSVGHGRVLGDLLDSARVPEVELVEIRRQGRGSRIVENAHRLLDGKPLLLSAEPASDFWFADLATEEGIGPDGFPLLHDEERSLREQEFGRLRLRRAIEYLVQHRGANPVRDVQVLSPMRRGLLGVDSLNEMLQEALNPEGERGPYIGGGVRVRVGDRVIQTRNDYTVPRGLFNGEQGEVLAASPSGESLTVRFLDREVQLVGPQLSSLRLAWAITVHRSQGSEFPYTLMVYHTSHYQMLDRAVLYTGLTRARRIFILLGTHRAIELTQRQARRSEVRYTGLVRRLMEEIPERPSRWAA